MIESSLSPTPEKTNESVGLCNPQMSQARRRMLDLVNGLHSTGVQVDIDLPRIAVVGNQSAGKSSLIESISGITLPRAAGTCTRCPTECRLSHSNTPWKCVVSLGFTTDAKGQPLGQSRNEVFGPPILDKTEVEDRIRRAQCAILNPDKPASTFLEEFDSDEIASSESALTFSMNCVSLAISGPDVADLSFVDLPGLIASVGRTGNSSDIQLVESLVVSYIKKSNCIILLTVACETDFENQGAHQLAKTYDPEGKRTIGVLTKPDRIPLGEESNWVRFIKNEKEPLENNWYCVKQPSSNDLKQSWSWQKARLKESEFFASTSPWCELESMYQKYLRTSNLLERLSSVLSDLIAKRLPEIQQEIECSILKTRQQIGQLPKPPPHNAMNEIAKLIKDFDADMKLHIQGIANKDGIIQRIRIPSEHFRRQIRSTAPEFQPFEKPIFKTIKMAEPEFLKNEEVQTHIEGKEDYEKKPIYVDEVYRRAQESRARELPGHYSFVVQQEYIRGVIGKWDEPAIALCDQVFQILFQDIKALVHKHFASFGQGGLEHQIRLLLHEHLGSCLEAAKSKTEWLLRVENDPYTLNAHYLSDYKEKFLAYYRRERERSRFSSSSSNDDGSILEAPAIHSPSRWNSRQAAIPGGGRRGGKKFSSAIHMWDEESVEEAVVERSDTETEALSLLTKLGYTGLKAEDLSKLLGPDMMEPALLIMADVRAYFQVAYKRFVDNVPMAIDYELVRGGERDVFQLLWTRLGLDRSDAHELCEEYAQEAPQVADRREELTKKLERLQEASRRLLNVGGT